MDDVKEKQPQIPVKIDNVKNVQWQDSIFPFDGAWQPAYDPTVIGPRNFEELTNIRYGENGIEGINGYVTRVTNALSPYVNIKKGIHFRTNRTDDSYILVHAQDSSGNGRVYQNKTAVGSVGDFESTQLHDDVSTNLAGRFSFGPTGTVAYANGEETKIWSGEEGPVGAVFLSTTSAGVNPVDYTEQLTNSRQDTSEVMELDTGRRYATIMTTRPIQSLKLYVKTLNTVADTLQFKYWNGSAYAAVSNLVDGTDVGGIPLAQTGIISFDSTVTTARMISGQAINQYVSCPWPCS